MSQNSGTRETRSQKYQFIINEICWDNEALCAFEDTSDINYEKKSMLRDQLLEEVKRVMKECLTQHQYEVAYLYYFKGLTQTEIAKHFNRNQSSIVKSLCGNRVGSGKNAIIYGGTISKLKKYCNADPIIIDILEKIEELI